MQIVGLPETCGYLYIFLNSPYGSALIKRFTYGGVVDALETSHLSSVEVPLLKDADTQAEINRLALEANELRHQAYQLEQKAMRIMDDEVLYAK
jgi:type I restriction enzyme S subunit